MFYYCENCNTFNTDNLTKCPLCGGIIKKYHNIPDINVNPKENNKDKGNSDVKSNLSKCGKIL